MFFSYPPRNLKPELLDLDEAAFDEVRDSLEDIRLVNKYLGGYKVLLHYFQKLAKRQRLDKETKQFICSCLSLKIQSSVLHPSKMDCNLYPLTR